MVGIRHTLGATAVTDGWILRSAYSDEAFRRCYRNHAVDSGLWTQWRRERTVSGASVYWFSYTD